MCRDPSLQAPKNIKQLHKHAPRNPPTSNKIHPRRNDEICPRFWYDFRFKNHPKMTPKSIKMAPLGSQGVPWGPLGEPWGPPDASRPIFGSNLAAQTTLKRPQNQPKCHPWALRKPLGGTMGPTRCLKAEFSPNMDPQMTIKSSTTNPICPRNCPTALTRHAPRPILAQYYFA